MCTPRKANTICVHGQAYIAVIMFRVHSTWCAFKSRNLSFGGRWLLYGNGSVRFVFNLSRKQTIARSTTLYKSQAHSRACAREVPKRTGKRQHQRPQQQHPKSPNDYCFIDDDDWGVHVFMCSVWCMRCLCVCVC